jgi:hypothetical protein
LLNRGSVCISASAGSGDAGEKCASDECEFVNHLKLLGFLPTSFILAKNRVLKGQYFFKTLN